jgi:hypothetical protein
MGLLDDAIREHLDLKRQHGAPEDEIERAEQEALAPARRDPAVAGVPPLEEVPGEQIEEPAAVVPPPPPPPLEEAPPPVDDPVYADEYAAEPAPADLDLDEEELEEAPFPGTPKPHGDEILGAPDHLVVTPDEPTDDPGPNSPEGDPLDHDEPGEEPPDRARTSILDDPLAEGPPPADDEQDVLEETPDFLQESPEHDKLWFEQKPPRDFDFD